jgi:hypothetical protein
MGAKIDSYMCDGILSIKTNGSCKFYIHLHYKSINTRNQIFSTVIFIALTTLERGILNQAHLILTLSPRIQCNI